MCKLVCIIAGLIAGALSWVLLNGLLSSLPLVLIAGFTFLATAWMCYEAFCGERAAISGKSAPAARSSTAGATDRDAWTSDDAPASGSPATPEGGNHTASLAASTGATTDKKETAKKPAAKAATKSGANKSKSAKAPARKAGPERLSKPKGKADNLKMITGVGPKLEKTLNNLGFWHFEQIAKWKKADIAIVDDELKFKGRIERDDWIKQARALAKGGEAEYIKVFGRKPR